MSGGRLFDWDDPGDVRPDAAAAKLSPTQRRTIRNRSILEAGRHPATGERLLEDGSTCGECVHHLIHRLNRAYHKCDVSRLGPSSSEASDIRVSWPACARFEPVKDLNE